MVATIKTIGSTGGAALYFYNTEKNYECDKSWLSTRGSEILGLNKIKRKEFEEILDGKITIKVEGKSKEILQLGRKTKDGIEHQAGQEVIFSAPKSVSIVHLVGKDERIFDAHKEAVRTIVDYVERHMIFARVQKDGIIKMEKTGNIAAASFSHITSRPPKSEGEKAIPDPQLHTHVLLANATKCKDGQWRSVVFDDLYKYKMFMGEGYRIELGRGLEKLGYNIDWFRDEKSKRWTFEINGGDNIKKDIEGFSKRRADIEEMAKAEGRYDSKSMAHFAKITREDKMEHSREELQKDWEGRVSNLSLLKQLVIEATEKKAAEVDNAVFNNNLDKSINYATGLLSEYEAVWKYTNLMEKGIEKGGGSFGIRDLESKIEKIAKEGGYLKGYDENLDALTTKRNLLAERDCINKLARLQGKEEVIMSQSEIRDNLQGINLNSGQRDAVQLVLNSKDMVVGIQGSAGVGKTTTVNVIRDIAAKKEYEIVGLAPTKSAASTMKEAVGCDAMTVHLFCAKYAGVIAGRGTEEGLREMREEYRNKIVVVDEASLVASDKMSEVLSLSEKLKFRLVLMGDSKQLGSVQAGKPFYYLQDHGMKTAIMQNIIRQRDEKLLSAVYASEKAVDKEELEARRDIKNAVSNIKSIVSVKDELKKENEKRGEEVAKEDINISNKDLAYYTHEEWEKLHNAGKESLVIALSNPLRREVNNLIREHYIEGSSQKHEIFERKSLARVQMRESMFYSSVKDVILFNKNYKEFQKGQYYSVISRVGEHGIKLIPYEKMLKIEKKAEMGDEGSALRDAAKKALGFDLRSIDSLREGSIELFTRGGIEVAKGERIRWTKNSKENDYIVNGDSAVIKDIKGKKVVIDTQSGEKHFRIDAKELKHIDHDYSHTAYGAQGKTKDNVIGVMRMEEKYLELATERAFYVTLSRAKHSAKLVVDDTKYLVESLASKTGEKTASVEHIDGRGQDNLKVVEQGKREVYIAKGNKSDYGCEDKVEQSCSGTEVKKKYDYNKMYNSFVSDKGAIEDVARRYFGEVNHKLSKANNLRFGRKGAISVNLTNGMWYDFSSGDSGSLFKAYKELGHKEEFVYEVKETVSTNKANAEEKSQQKKLQIVEKISKSAIPLNNKTKVVNNYLIKHREINLSNINLSRDVRSTAKAWSSETKRHHVALVAIAKDKDGKEKGAQTIYLDPKTHNKDKSLEINKRTMGVLKGSFVELTNNKKSNEVYIAEGVETGLSIAASDKEARVIVGLGISNMLNISSYLKSTDKNKDITIVADNDGRESQTAKIIDKAARKLSKEGFENVMVIKPKVKGYDFNDVLKIRGEKGVRAYMESSVKNQLDISGIKTRDLGIEELKEGLEEVVKQNLRVTDNKRDYVSHQTIVEKMAGKIINHRNVYGKEISGAQKKQFYNESRYELNRQEHWKKYVESKNPAKEVSDLLKQQEITERLVNIDTRLADRSSENYQPMPADQVLREYKENTTKIHESTKELSKKGYGVEATEFIAREMVKYQEKYGYNMPTQQITKLCSISNYVQKQYDMLAKFGFSKDEARISFNEGSRMLAKYDRGKQDFMINKEEVKSIQQHSKHELEINALKQQNSKSIDIANDGFGM